tara:strand:+ start:68 stop:469 length:402 start_codon:yes stop_codon:yes gene_type:complete
MGDFQDLLNRFTKGEFNYERMGNIPEVRKRTNTILNDPRQMLLNTDANYSNMGSYVPNMPMPQEPQQPDFRQVPGTDMGNMAGLVSMGITRIPSVSPVEQIKSGKALDQQIKFERYDKKLKRMEENARRRGLV